MNRFILLALLWSAVLFGGWALIVCMPVPSNVMIPALAFTFFALAALLFRLTVYPRLDRIRKKVGAIRKVPSQKYPGDVMADIESELDGFTEDRIKEQDHLRKLEDYRKEFLGNVSHELKTPIFNIQGYIHTLLDGGLDDPKINRDYLQRAARSVDRMIAIVEDLQAITQFESGELVLEQERFDIVALVSDVLDAQALQARERKITFEFVNQPAEAIQVMGDRFRIRQVLVNLVVNSVRYGKEGGNTQVRVHDLGEKVKVEVADNGIGIAKVHLPRIFERFYRADKSRSREMGGTGLGLAIVKHIIEGHGQTIDVMSTEGAGSVFSFTLKKA
jgi:two-component system phosphate regulon sensor histidine kinase PhoR